MTDPLAVTRSLSSSVVRAAQCRRSGDGGSAVPAFIEFDADGEADVAILTGNGGAFCARADLRALTEGERKPIQPDGDFAPMGPTPPETIQTRYRGH